MRAFFLILLFVRSSKSVLQLCGISELVDIVFITNQNGYDSSTTSMYFENIWLSAVHALQQSSLM